MLCAFLNLECPLNCGLVFCDINCKKRKWHSSTECGLLKEAEELRNRMGFKLLRGNEISNWLLVLRCLLLQKTLPENWENLQLLDDNLDEGLYKKKHLQTYNEHVLNPLKRVFPSITSNFKDNEILELCAKLDSNAFRQGECCRALFAVASMLNHSCVPNARVVFDVDGNVKILAKSYIEIGDEITITYCSQLLGTWVSYFNF